MGSKLTILEGDAATDRSVVMGEGDAQSRAILPGRKIRGEQASAFERARSQSGTPLLVESSGIALWVSNNFHGSELSVKPTGEIGAAFPARPTYRR